jgi:hypothetical protein
MTHALTHPRRQQAGLRPFVPLDPRAVLRGRLEPSLVGEIVRQVGQRDASGDSVPRDAADVRLVRSPIASREVIQRFDYMRYC